MWCITVAPLVGAWIEINDEGYYCSTCAVAPLVGAWIEIKRCKYIHRLSESLPSWERGLKYMIKLKTCFPRSSLPSWERGLKSKNNYDYSSLESRSPRGSVD